MKLKLIGHERNKLVIKSIVVEVPDIKGEELQDYLSTANDFNWYNMYIEAYREVKE